MTDPISGGTDREDLAVAINNTQPLLTSPSITSPITFSILRKSYFSLLVTDSGGLKAKVHRSLVEVTMKVTSSMLLDP